MKKALIAAGVVLVIVLAGFIFWRPSGVIAPSAASAHISGKVEVEACPVVREGYPCNPAPEVYTARQIVIYKKDGKTEVTRFPLNSDGTYEATLKPGAYVLDIVKQGVDSSISLPHPFTVSEGQSLKFDFSISTGIQ